MIAASGRSDLFTSVEMVFVNDGWPDDSLEVAIAISPSRCPSELPIFLGIMDVTVRR
jgi:hypothetical protein